MTYGSGGGGGGGVADTDEQNLLNGRFRMGGLLGEGGMSIVYAGEDITTGEPVAIKILKPEIIHSNPNLVERFAREGEVLRRLNHPNIVKILAAFEQDGKNYVVMEKVMGGDLAELLKASGKLPIERVLEISLDLADALARAHRINVIHRDIKPANVLMADDGTPRLTDFGVARLEDATSVTKSGTMVGTIAYLSPEGCIGEVLDARTDIWSFGIMLYEMLTGYRPFMDVNTAALITAILSRPVPPLDKLRQDCPPALAQLVVRMLEKDRDKRISSARQVGAVLEAIISGHDPSAIIEGDTGTALPPVRAIDDDATIAPPSDLPSYSSVQNAVDEFKTTRGTPPPTPMVTPPTTGEINSWHLTSRRMIDRPPRIFISYRRGDSAAITGRLYERLVSIYGEENVFKDINTASQDVNFRQAVEAAILHTDVLLVVIGQSWDAVATRGGTPRLEHDDDIVRLEVETGLTRDSVLVIPVLVNGADMPAHLPDKLDELRYRNAATLRTEPDFNSDAVWLIDQINKSFYVESAASTPIPPSRRANRIPLFAAVLLVIFALLAAVMILPRLGTGFTVQTVAPVQSNEYMVMVAQLEGLRGATDDVSRFIVDDLRRKFEEEAVFSAIRVRAYPGVITSAEQAAQAAEANNAPLVIWGNYDGTVTELNVQVGSLAQYDALPFSRDNLENIVNVSLRLTDTRQQSIAASVVAAYNAIFTGLQDTYNIGANLAALDLVRPDSPEVIGSSSAARWHRFLSLWVTDIEAGLAEVTLAIQLDSTNPVLYAGRALGRLRAGHIEEAALDARTAQQLSPGNWGQADVLLGQIALLVNNDAAAALPHLNEAVRKNPDNWFTLTLRAVAHYMLGDQAASQTDINSALALDPQFNAPYAFASLFTLREGKLQETLDLVNRVRREFPDPTLGDRLMRGAFDISVDQSPLMALISAFGNFTLLQWPDVIEDSEIVIALSDELIGIYMLKGVAECNLGRYEDAEASYTALLDADPGFTTIYLLRAEVRRHLGDLLGAAADVGAAANTPQWDVFAPYAPAFTSGEITCENFFNINLDQYQTSP